MHLFVYQLKDTVTCLNSADLEIFDNVCYMFQLHLYDLLHLYDSARDCDSWRCCNTSQQRFYTKLKHHVFLGRADCYDVRHFSFYDPIVRPP